MLSKNLLLAILAASATTALHTPRGVSGGAEILRNGGRDIYARDVPTEEAPLANLADLAGGRTVVENTDSTAVVADRVGGPIVSEQSKEASEAATVPATSDAASGSTSMPTASPLAGEDKPKEVLSVHPAVPGAAKLLGTALQLGVQTIKGSAKEAGKEAAKETTTKCLNGPCPGTTKCLGPCPWVKKAARGEPEPTDEDVVYVRRGFGTRVARAEAEEDE